PLAVAEAPRLSRVVWLRLQPGSYAGLSRRRSVGAELTVPLVRPQPAAHARPHPLHAVLDGFQALAARGAGHLLPPLGHLLHRGVPGESVPPHHDLLVPLAPGPRAQHVADSESHEQPTPEPGHTGLLLV